MVANQAFIVIPAERTGPSIDRILKSLSELIKLTNLVP